jgi:hypothetical protein
MMMAGRRCLLFLRMLLPGALAAIFVLLPFVTGTWAQDSSGQQGSVAEAARRAKQKKNAAAGKTSKVIDDDNLSSNLKTGGPDVTNVGASAAATANPGAAANPQAGSSAEAADQATAKQGDQDSPKKNEGSAAQDEPGKEQDAEITKMKEQAAEVEKELDLLKREFALDSGTYYSKTNYSSDKAGKAKLDDEQQQIASKQQELEQVKARLATLQEQHSRRKGKSSSPAAAEGEKPATPQQL